MVHTTRLRDIGKMIKNNRRGIPLFEDRHDLQDLAAGALIWICQPSSLICLESGSSIWGVVAPAWAKLKRMPRTPSACMRSSSSVDTASLTTAALPSGGSVRKLDEPLPQSITSSARTSSVEGMVRPSALAVLRLITILNVVGSSTGRLAGLMPFKTLSARPATRRYALDRLGPYDMNPPSSASVSKAWIDGRWLARASSAISLREPNIVLSVRKTTHCAPA